MKVKPITKKVQGPRTEKNPKLGKEKQTGAGAWTRKK